MNANDIRKITDGIYKLGVEMEDQDYSSDNLNACKVLYSYYQESAADKSAKNRTEGYLEFEDLVENGLTEVEIDYMETYEPKAYVAYKLIGREKAFRLYCYYMELKEQMRLLEEDSF